MKQRLALAALLLAGAMTACTGLPRPVPPQLVEESGAVSDPSPREDQGSEQEPPLTLKGVEGSYLIVEKSYLSNPAPASKDDYLILAAMLDFSEAVVTAWEISNGRQGPTLLEAWDPKTGESLFRLALEGYAYAVERTGSLPDDYRVVARDKIIYLSSEDAAYHQVYTLPQQVAAQLWEEPGAGAPYDYLRDEDLLVFSGEEGIYRSGGDGEDPALVLANSDLPAALAETRITRILEDGEALLDQPYQLPVHRPDQLRYTAPLLMHGGTQLIATSYLMGGDSGEDSRCVGITMLELETGAVHYVPLQISPLSGPARKLNSGSVVFNGLDGPGTAGFDEQGLGMFSFGLYDQYPHEARTWDYNNYVRVREGEDGGWELYRYKQSTPDKGLPILTSNREMLHLLAVGDRYVLCQTGEYEGEQHLLLVPYVR